ncbi:unnamed protein product [Camellia sinensis]
MLLPVRREQGERRRRPPHRRPILLSSGISAASFASYSKENKDEDYWRYLPLLKAALRGDWDSAKRFFDQHPDALTAYITDYKHTALSVAIMSGRSIEFVEKLVDRMPPEALALRSSSGATALLTATLYGKTKAAVILVKKHPTSLYIRDNDNWLPLHCAANGGHKNTLLYLLSVTKEDDPVSKPFAYPSGALLLSQVVGSEFYAKKKKQVANSLGEGTRGVKVEEAVKQLQDTTQQQGQQLETIVQMITALDLKYDQMSKNVSRDLEVNLGKRAEHFSSLHNESSASGTCGGLIQTRALKLDFPKFEGGDSSSWFIMPNKFSLIIKHQPISGFPLLHSTWKEKLYYGFDGINIFSLKPRGKILWPN